MTEQGLVKRVVHDLLASFTGLSHVVYMDNFYTSGPLADELAKDEIYTVGTIKANARGYPQELRSVTPKKGDYAALTSGEKVYSVFNDRKVVRFMSNAFPESMSSQVARTQPDGSFRYQSIPPLLPAYNKYMGGVDLTDQLRKTYGFDRKSKRAWIRLFYCFFDLAINNAFILYKLSSQGRGLRPKRLLKFRLELSDLLVEMGPCREVETEGCGRSCPCSKGTYGGTCMPHPEGSGHWLEERKVPTLLGDKGEE